LKPKFCRTSAFFRTWLEKNHATATELWVGFYKRNGWTSALSLSQGKQNHDDAERCRNRGGGEPCGRDFSAGMKTFLQSCSKADQKEKKSQANQYYADCSLVIGRDSHRRKQSNTIARQNSSALFEGKALIGWCAGLRL
jgi:hypothetical protein